MWRIVVQQSVNYGAKQLTISIELIARIVECAWMPLDYEDSLKRFNASARVKICCSVVSQLRSKAINNIHRVDCVQSWMCVDVTSLEQVFEDSLRRFDAFARVMI